MLRNILSYLKPYTSLLLLNLLSNGLSVLFSLVSLTMVIPFLQLLFDKQRLVENPPSFAFSPEWVIGWFNYLFSQVIVLQGKPAALIWVCGVVVLVFFLKNLFRFGAGYFMAYIRNGVVRDVRSRVFAKILSLPISYFSEKRKGDLITRLSADVQEIESSVVGIMEVTIREPLTAFVYLGAMFFISIKLSLFVLLVLPFMAFIIGRIGRSLRRKSHKAQTRLSLLLSVLDETLSGMRVIKGFRAEAAQTRRFETENNAHRQLATAILQRREASSPLSEFLSICVVALTLYTGGMMVLAQDGQLSADTFIGFMLIFSQIIQPAKLFTSALFQLQKGMASMERVNEILEQEAAVYELPNAFPLPHFAQQIEFRNVSFAYEQRTILDNINIVLPKGQTLALVGASGAGKSTLADLLPRFYDPTQGTVLIDGQDISKVRLNDLRQHIGIVTQDPVLFNDTVFNNIAFGMSEMVKEEQVIAAAKVANAHEFITNLEQGYQTNIGDRGCRLSGGERQRLTIARAVLRNPPILILDEATSSLDAEAEKQVQDALYRLLENRTALVIAHRLATVQHADQIVVLNQGRVAETGTHESLMNQTNGLYRRLVELQTIGP